MTRVTVRSSHRNRLCLASVDRSQHFFIFIELEPREPALLSDSLFGAGQQFQIALVDHAHPLALKMVANLLYRCTLGTADAHQVFADVSCAAFAIVSSNSHQALAGLVYPAHGVHAFKDFAG